jgi:hypothetical protein
MIHNCFVFISIEFFINSYFTYIHGIADQIAIVVFAFNSRWIVSAMFGNITNL